MKKGKRKKRIQDEKKIIVKATKKQEIKEPEKNLINKNDIEEKKEENNTKLKKIFSVFLEKCNDVVLFFNKKSVANWLLVIITLTILFGLYVSIFSVYKNGQDMRKKEIEEKRWTVQNFPKGRYNGDGFVTEIYPIFKDVVIVGDSYSHFLALDAGFDLRVFARSGWKIGALKEVFQSVAKTKEKYVVIFIGPNDLRAQTSINVFKKNLVENVNILKENKKQVLIVTYLNSEFTEEIRKNPRSIITVQDYNNVILDVCKEENITYIDAKGINNYHYDKRTENGIVDTLHFNQKFNIKMINKIYEYLYDMVLAENEDK